MCLSSVSDEEELSQLALRRLTRIHRDLRLISAETVGGGAKTHWRLEGAGAPFTYPHLRILLRNADEARNYITAIHSAVQDIASSLEERWPSKNVLGTRQDSGRCEALDWCLGSISLQVDQRPFLRGFVDVREKLLIAPYLPARVVLFLQKIPGTRDMVVRERHGHWGYHYHYLDHRSHRSDTLLTFDRLGQGFKQPTLFWERHAQGGKFRARAERWGDGKRESIYSVCFPDTSRWPSSDFKKPDAGAKPVWPTT